MVFPGVTLNNQGVSNKQVNPTQTFDVHLTLDTKSSLPKEKANPCFTARAITALNVLSNFFTEFSAGCSDDASLIYSYVTLIDC